MSTGFIKYTKNNDVLYDLKFYYKVLKFLDMNIIIYISAFNKATDGNYQTVFDSLRTKLGLGDFDVKYMVEYRNVKNFSSEENIRIILGQLSNKAEWPNVLSKIILWKILYLYEFSEKIKPKIKEFCQNKIDGIL
jgi:hypothetical protein